MFEWLQPLLLQYGYWVVFGVIFLNNLGFPIPGDAMLLGSGFLVEKGAFNFWGIVSVGTLATFLGGNSGYLIGLYLGERFVRRIAWFRFTPPRIRKIQRFFKKHGAKSVFFARFVALLQPVTGLLAGIGRTPWRPFLLYNFAGSFGYALVYTLVGQFFGQRWELIKDWIGYTVPYLVLILLVILLLIQLAADGKRTGNPLRKRRSSI